MHNRPTACRPVRRIRASAAVALLAVAGEPAAPAATIGQTRVARWLAELERVNSVHCIYRPKS